MRARHLGLLLGALLALGCSDSTAPGFLNGTWTHDFGFPGSSLEFTLTTNGNAVTGAGTWVGEACCAGPVAITGEATGGLVNLDFSFTANGGVVPPYTYHFTGHLVGVNTLSGTVVANGTSSPYTYRRVP